MVSSEIENRSTEIIDICRRLYDRGYIIAKSGNVSCRLNNNNILITPSRLRKHHLNTNEFCIIDLEGNKISEGLESPSSEYRIHCETYKNRPDITTIIHAHAEYSIVCSLSTIVLEDPILPETALSLGSIPTIPYSPPGSQELADSIIPFLKDHDAFILERHGVVAMGSDLEEAFDRLEEVEHAAKIAYRTSVKGRIPRMGRSQLMKIVCYAKEHNFPVSDIAMKLLNRILAK